jgi:hypothetical protein
VLRKKIKSMLYSSRNLNSRSSSRSRSRSRIRSKRSSSIVAAAAVVVSETKAGSTVYDSVRSSGGSSFSDYREVIIMERWDLTI